MAKVIEIKAQKKKRAADQKKKDKTFKLAL